MKKEKITHSRVLETETIGEGNQLYFIDLCMAVNNTLYLRLVRSDRVTDANGKVRYNKEKVRIFDEKIGPWIDGISTVFGRYHARQGK